jgi:hypothetical protein
MWVFGAQHTGDPNSADKHVRDTSHAPEYQVTKGDPYISMKPESAC